MKGWLPLGLSLLLCGCPPSESGGDADVPDSGVDAGAPDGGDGGTGADAGLPVKLACSVLNARKCDYLSRCGLIGASSTAVRDCLGWLQATSCGPSKWPSRVEPPISTLRYDPVTSQLCANAWLTRSCADSASEPLACKSFLLPNAYLKQACYDGYTECVGNNVCRSASCPRTCQARGVRGEDCRENSDCASTDAGVGLYCLISNTSSGAGECTLYGASGALCASDQPCAADLLCSAGRCVVPPLAEQPCLGSACDETAWCQNGADGGICLSRKDGGASCTDDLQCQAGLLCEVLTGLCVPRQLREIGANCGLRQTCPLGTSCVNATATSLGSCVAPSVAGASCVSSNDCQANLACIGLDGGLALGCGPRQPAGARCAEDRDCQLLSVCRQLTCVRLPVTGESCSVTQSCLFGPCVASDGGATCVEPFGPGLLCARDADCSSGRCVTGKCLPTCTP